MEGRPTGLKHIPVSCNMTMQVLSTASLLLFVPSCETELRQDPSLCAANSLPCAHEFKECTVQKRELLWSSRMVQFPSFPGGEGGGLHPVPRQSLGLHLLLQYQQLSRPKVQLFQKSIQPRKREKEELRPLKSDLVRHLLRRWK